MSRNYDNPIEVTVREPAADLTTAAVVARVFGPAGKTGRVLSATGVVGTDTDAVALITIDTNAGVTTPVTLSVASAPGSNTGFTASEADLAAQSDLPADTVVEISVDGVPTAGTADLDITIGWF